jgi:hypothetical protein
MGNLEENWSISKKGEGIYSADTGTRGMEMKKRHL